MFGYKLISTEEYEELHEELASLRGAGVALRREEMQQQLTESTTFVDIGQLHPVSVERAHSTYSKIQYHQGSEVRALHVVCSLAQHESLVAEAKANVVAPITQAEYNEIAQVCAEAYQVLGQVADRAGLFDDDTIIKTLDNLITMSLEYTDVLPFDLPPPKKRARKASAPSPINTGEQTT